ncbi:Chlorogenic acid esterase [Botrytis cinerea]
MVYINSFSGIVATLLFFIQAASSRPHWESKSNVNLSISTTSGSLQGIINGTTPNVRQFLGVPFAQPPTGDLRWMPPNALPSNQSSAIIDATKFSLNCPQYESAIPSIYNTFVREFFIWGPSGENCLTLGIWAPLHSQPEDKLPVLIFLYGGGLQTGGSSVPYQNPSKWVERTQSHIVVSIQYRVNIFGFPNAPGLESQNLGYLDQRAGVEWLQKNVAAFGGDPDQMVLWGQSAGASSTDAYNYAYPDDPIVKGFICNSGTSLTSTPINDPSYSNFTFVASHFNCTGTELLSCMRQIPADDIEAFLKSYNDALTTPTLSFNIIRDDKIVFQNYTQRLIDNQISPLPVVYGFNDNDTMSLDAFPEDPLSESANRTLASINQVRRYVCPNSAASYYRTQLGLKTYRFQYRGNFSNVAPLAWAGAYHSSELPMIFGTSEDFRGKNTELEWETSRAMQDAWLAFARKPDGGLEELGWGNSSGQVVEVFGGRSTYDDTGKNVAKQFISLKELAESCSVK